MRGSSSTTSTVEPAMVLASFGIGPAAVRCLLALHAPAMVSFRGSRAAPGTPTP
jgi:hypothetical protein